MIECSEQFLGAPYLTELDLSKMPESGDIKKSGANNINRFCFHTMTSSRKVSSILIITASI